MEGQGCFDWYLQDAGFRASPAPAFNFDGDRQADLSVHGGKDKAVYVYPAEHYAYWRRELPDTALPWGIFGENLTTEGLQEDTLQVGDRFRIGSTEVVVTQPRLPCYKLGLRFGRGDIVKRFLASGRLGFYFRVVTEGDIAAGDPIALVERARDSVAVSEVTRLYAHDKNDLEGLRRIVDVAALPADWRDYFKEQISRIGAHVQVPATQPNSAWTGFRPFSLREKVRESESVASFHLVPEDGQPLPPYLPGQFLTVRLAIPVSSALSCDLTHCRRLPGPTDTASQSSGSGPIREIRAPRPDSLSSHFHDRLAVGDRIEAKAPAGTFTIEVRQHDRPVVLIGGGIGITPLLSMLNSIVAAESSREVWLLYSVHDDREHIMRTHLETIARAHTNVHLHVFYSRPTDTMDDPSIHTGHIDLHAMQRLIPSTAFDFYVCGPPAMMDSVTRDFEAWGVPADRVHTEAFGPATIKQALRGPTARPDCGFDVTFARSDVTALWSRCDLPLLELAEEHSVRIDFGCRAGSCGTCVTRILSGAVRYLHQPNAPLEVGEILACIAVPVEPLTLDA